MAWTSVAKPTTPSWLGVYVPGKQSYDDPSLSYDQSDTYYDGYSPMLWNTVAKPTTPSWVSVAKPT